MAHPKVPNRGVVAAGHELTAAAGAEMLRQGGNAFDAAIAAVMTAWVSESVLTSAGGGGFLLAHTATGQDCLFDFFTQTPGSNRLQQQPDFYPIYANFGDTVQEFHIGLGSIAVPGAIAGLLHIHQKLGRLPLAAIVEPALHHARNGVVVNPFLAYVYQLLDPILTASPAAREIFADTLSDLVEQGAAAFYDGAIAERIVQDCQSAGGYLSRYDLQNYRVIERSPLRLQYRNTTFLTNPPPSSGGALIGFALKLLEKAQLPQSAPSSVDHLRLLTRVMALTNEARRDDYDNRLYEAGVADAFLSALSKSDCAGSQQTRQHHSSQRD